MAINLIEKIQVSPATNSFPDSVNSLSLPLTLLDLTWLKSNPNQLLFFFKLPESTREFFNSNILPKLKLSLSNVLRHYLPLVGSIKWAPQEPKPAITVSKHDTVSLTIAETNTDFFQISGNGLRFATELHPFVPELTFSHDSVSVMSLQITVFPNQGFSLGISSHHTVFDFRTTEMFVKSWAHICKSKQSLLPENLIPSFDRTIINISPILDAKMLQLLCTDNVKNLNPPPIHKINANRVRVTLNFTSENIEKLRQQIMNESTRSPNESTRSANESTRSPNELQYLSNYVIAYAYVLTCAVKARGGHASRPVSFSYVAGMNHRLKPRVPVTYFGNCVFPVGWFEYEARVFWEENGFVKIAEILSDSVKKLSSRGIETLLESFIEGSKRLKEGTQTGSISGSPKLGIYGSDFGWGIPEKIEVVSIDRNAAFSMLDRKDGLSEVEMGVCLKDTEMKIFLSLFNNGLNH